MTWLGQAQGWRAAYLLAGGIFVLALALAARSLPTLAGDPTANARRELAAFANRQVWLVMGVGAIGFGGFFAVYAYLADVTTHVTGLAAKHPGRSPWRAGHRGRLRLPGPGARGRRARPRRPRPGPDQRST